jgi:O-antigen ligase
MAEQQTKRFFPMNAVISLRPEPQYSSARLEGAPAPRRLSPVLCGICGLLVFAILSFGGVEQWSISVLEIGSGLLSLAWAARQLLCAEIEIQSNPLYLPAALFGLAVVLQLSLNLTAYRYATLVASLEYLAYGMILFLTAQSLVNAQCSKLVIWVFVLFGFALAMFAVTQNLSSNGKIYWVRLPRNGGAIFGPYVNRDHYAGLMEMLCPVPIVLTLGALLRGTKRILLGFAGVIMAGSIVLSQSRAGAASFFVEMALLLGLLLGTRRRTRVGAAIGSVCLMAIAFAAWFGSAELWHHFSNLQDWMRLAIFKDGLRMFWRKPILGWGLGTFTTVYPQFRSFYTNLFVNAAHNDYIQALVETGIIGFAAILWFVIATYRGGLRNLTSWRHSWSRTLGLAALIGCTGILVHSALDFNLQIPANAGVFYFLAAVTTSTASLPEPSSSRRSSRSSARGASEDRVSHR